MRKFWQISAIGASTCTLSTTLINLFLNQIEDPKLKDNAKLTLDIAEYPIYNREFVVAFIAMRGGLFTQTLFIKDIAQTSYALGASLTCLGLLCASPYTKFPMNDARKCSTRLEVLTMYPNEENKIIRSDAIVHFNEFGSNHNDPIDDFTTIARLQHEDFSMLERGKLEFLITFVALAGEHEVIEE